MRLHASDVITPDHDTQLRRIELFRGAWSVAMLLAPKPVLSAVDTGGDRTMVVVGRTLGARHLTQAVLSGARPSPEVLAMGVWVDAVHALTALGLAAVSPSRTSAGLFDAVCATGWAIAGYHDLVTPALRRARAHPPPRCPGPLDSRAAAGRTPSARARRPRARQERHVLLVRTTLAGGRAQPRPALWPPSAA